MAITLVQSNSNTATGVSTFTVAYTSNNTAGNFLAMMTREPNGSGNTYLVTDTNNNTWNSALKFNNGTEQWEMFYVMNCAGGANTVSVTKQGGGSFNYRAIITEFSGLRIGSILDFATSNTGTSSNPNTVYITPNFSTELLLGFFANQNTDNVSPVSDSSWTAITNVTGNLAAFYKLLPFTPPSSFTGQLLNWLSQQYAGSIAAFAANASTSFVRSYSGIVGGASVSSLTTSTLTLTAGDVGIIIVKWEGSSSTTDTVTDSLGNTWTPIASTKVTNTNFGSGGSITQQIFYSVITTGGSGTITANFGTTIAFPIIAGAEFSGINISTPVQTQNTSTGNAVPTTGSVSITGNVVLFSTIVMTNGTNVAIATNPPWVPLYNNQFMSNQYIIVDKTYNFVGGISSSNPWGVGMAGFISNTITLGNYISAFRDFVGKHNVDDDYRKSR